MKALSKVKVWALSIGLAIITILFGLNRLGKRRRAKERRVTSARVAVLLQRKAEEKTTDAAARVLVAERRRALEAHAEKTDKELDKLTRSIDERESRIWGLRRRIAAARGERMG